MKPTQVLGLLGGLLVLAFIANRLYRKTRVPDVLVLMVTGLLIGPVFSLIDPANFKGVIHAFGTLTVVLILFEGGLELNLRDALRHFSGGVLLTLVAFGLSTAAVALLVWRTAGLPMTSALLVGGVLGCTSSAIVLPVLQQMEAREPLRVTLLLEASLGDVFAVLTVEVLLDMVKHGGPVISGFASGFVFKFAPALVVAFLAGVVWSRLLPLLSEQKFWHVLTFSVVLLLYAATEAMGASGLIAALAFGLTLSNFPGIAMRMVEAPIRVEAPAEEHHVRVLSFHSELAFLARTFFFVMIGVVAEFSGLRGYLLLTVGVLAALFVARWVALLISRPMLRELVPHEHDLVLWILPRGLVTAVLAIHVLQEGGEVFAFLPALAFAIILATNLILVFAGTRAPKPEAPSATQPLPQTNQP